MTVRADFPTRGATAVPLHAPSARPLAEGFLAPIAGAAAALFFDAHATGAGRRRLSVEADGAPLNGPVVSTAVPTRSGRVRHVVLVGHPADRLVARRVVLSLGGVPASVLDPEWLQSPLVDIPALFEGLTEAGCQRLLRLFLTTAASLLGREAPGFAAAAQALLALLGVRRLDPLGWCRTGAASRIVSYRLPEGFDAARVGPLVTLTATAMARVADTPTAVETRRDGVLLHVSVAGATPEDAVLVTTGPEPLALSLPADTGALPVERWLAARDAATRAWCGRLLDAAAPRDALAAAVLRELRHRDAPAPTLAVEHLSGTPAGVVHAFRLADPHGLVRAVGIVRGDGAVTLPVDGALAGYSALPRTTSIDDRVRIALVLHSGRVLPMSEWTLARFEGDAPGLAPGALAAARLDRETAGRVARVEAFGPPAPTPTLSLVAPFPTDCPDIVATRAALAFAEPGGAGVEIVYHATDGADATAARAVLERAATTWGISHRLLVATADLDPAARLAAAVAAAQAPGVLVLDADVLPAEAGWLAPWRRLSARHPMLRAAVAGHDGRPEADTAACVGFFRAAVAPLLGSATPYGAPSVLAAETAARLAGRGTPEARLGLVFRRYGETSLTPFEKSVDAAALALILERSFTLGCDEGRP